MSFTAILNSVRSKIAQWIQPSPTNTPGATQASSPTTVTSASNHTSSTFSASTPISNQYTTPTETKEIVQQELQREAKDLRKDFISIFGLFAAFITFTVLQIQALIQSARMALIVGCMSFFLAVSLTFVLSLHNMIHEKNGWKEFTRPVFAIILVIFFFSFECFWYASHQGKFFLFG